MSRKRLAELAERGAAASPAGVPSEPAVPVAKPGACKTCNALPDELCAFVPWPAECDPKRCLQCNALLSFRYPIGPALYARRTIDRWA